MSEKKGLLEKLLGKKSGGCCGMEITEEKETCCCVESEIKSEQEGDSQGEHK